MGYDSDRLCKRVHTLPQFHIEFEKCGFKFQKGSLQLQDVAVMYTYMVYAM